MATKTDYRKAAKSLFPFFPDQLLTIFTNEWVETGDPQLALAKVRQSSEYETFFPGNQREDGSVRMSEADYMAGREAFQYELTQYGINIDAMQGFYPQLVAGGVSVSDMRRRMALLYTEIESNIDTVRTFYASMHGIEVSLPSLMASALNPGTNPAVFEREIQQAQIGGEAALRGFNINLDEVRRLSSFGMTQQAAGEFFTQASSLLPTLGILMERHNDPDDEFTLEELTDALIVGDPRQRQTMERLFAQEQSTFSPFGLFQVGQGGVVGGLRQN